MTRLLALLAAVASAAGMLIAAPTAVADDTTCTGILIGGTYDNVIVPPGMSCNLEFATVLGNVKALENARLEVFRSTIEGNVEGDKAESVFVSASNVHGNIEIKEGEVDDLGRDVLISASVGGNIKVEKMRGDVFIRPTTLVEGNVQVFENVIPAPARLLIDGVHVAENLQVSGNTGTGLKEVFGNTVDQSIQCFFNDPVFVGGPNVSPKIEGQCS